MTERRRRRRWSIEEKRRIVAQTRVAGVSVSQIARRYDVNANLIFKWLRDSRYCSAVDASPDDTKFLAVDVSRHIPPVGPERVCSEVPGTVRILLSNGHRLEISGDYDPDAIVCLARGLAGGLST